MEVQLGPGSAYSDCENGNSLKQTHPPPEPPMTPTSTQYVVAFPEAEVSILDAYLRGLPGPATRKVYRQAIVVFDGFLGERDLFSATRRDVEAYRAHLETAGRAPATISKILSALSGIFVFAVEEGVAQRNPVALARRPKLPDVSNRKGLSATEVKSLLAVPDVQTLAGLRDRAMLTVLAVQGWRLAELLGLRIEDLGEEQGHRVATIIGKGSKVARVPLAAATWSTISAWTTAASIAAGPVFLPVLKGGRLRRGHAISQQAAWCRVRLLAERAGIPRHVHPHLFRHGAVTSALASGVALHLVQDFARHADPRTTRRYDSHRQSLSNPTAHVLAAALIANEVEP